METHQSIQMFLMQRLVEQLLCYDFFMDVLHLRNIS